MQRNWVFATNSNFLIPISLQPGGVGLWHFKLRLFDLTEFKVWNILSLRHWVAKVLGLENLSLWQRLNSFPAKPTVFETRFKFFKLKLIFSFSRVKSKLEEIRDHNVVPVMWESLIYSFYLIVSEEVVEKVWLVELLFWYTLSLYGEVAQMSLMSLITSFYL